ncbi:MAG: aldo/keto reductase [Thermodesulfobacteriota bacterium]
MELGLGAVQFGLDYGVSNRQGRTPEPEVRRILELAAASGVRILDTAAAYGGSEAVLGRCLPVDSSFRIITKTAPLREARGSADAPRLVREGFARSLERLGREAVDGLLAHHAADLLGPGGEAVFAVLDGLRREGLARKIGLSVYAGAEIDAALDRYDFDLVQVPANVLDQRLVSGGQFRRLRERGVEVHVRSVFLQGLLLMDPAAAPAWFEPVRPRLAAWRAALSERGLTPVQGALAFARTLDADVVLVGVENAAQLAANIADFAAAADAGLDFAPFALDDEQFVNPARWNLAA